MNWDKLKLKKKVAAAMDKREKKRGTRGMGKTNVQKQKKKNNDEPYREKKKRRWVSFFAKRISKTKKNNELRGVGSKKKTKAVVKPSMGKETGASN